MDISKTNNEAEKKSTPQESLEVAQPRSEPATSGDDFTDQPPIEIVKIGKKNLAAVYITLTKEEIAAGKSNILSFTPREAFILKTFLKYKSWEETAKICEITVLSVKRYFRRPDLSRYLEELLEQAAIKSGTTVNWLLATLRKAAEGKVTPDDDQKWALKQIQDIIVKKGPGVVVNNNNQTNIYGDMDKGVIDAEWADAQSTASL